MPIARRLPPNTKQQTLSSSLANPSIWLCGSWGSGKSHSWMTALYPMLALQQYDETPIVGERLDDLCDLAESLYGDYQARMLLLDCGATGATLAIQQQRLHKIEWGGQMLLALMKAAAGL